MFDRVVSLTHLNLDRLELGSSSWGMQFRNAMSVNGGDVENATTLDYIMHFITFAWKVNCVSLNNNIGDTGSVPASASRSFGHWSERTSVTQGTGVLSN
jgi:hypothetical protein